MGRRAGGDRADLHLPGLEPDLQLLPVAHDAAAGAAGGRGGLPLPAFPAIPRRGAAVRGDPAALELGDELGRRLVLPDGLRELPGGNPRLPAAGARLVSAGGGRCRRPARRRLGDRRPRPRDRPARSARLAAVARLGRPVQGRDDRGRRPAAVVVPRSARGLAAPGRDLGACRRAAERAPRRPGTGRGTGPVARPARPRADPSAPGRRRSRARARRRLRGSPRGGDARHPVRGELAGVDAGARSHLPARHGRAAGGARLDGAARSGHRHQPAARGDSPTPGAGGGFGAGDGALPGAPARVAAPARRSRHRRHRAHAARHPVVPAVQRHRRGDGHPPGSARDHGAAASRPLGSLAHPRPAGALPVSRHRPHHRGRRGVEREHRRRARGVRRTHLHDPGRGRRHRRRHQRGALSAAPRGDAVAGGGRGARQPHVLATPLSRRRGALPCRMGPSPPPR